MVGSHLHQAFRSWFKETESDGTPLLPAPLSKKYKVMPHVLGQGSFAVVKMVVEKATGEERALKIIAKKPLKDSNEKMLKEEIAILGKVEHPYIIKMWDLYETKEGVFIVTDLCRGGELFDRLVEKVHYNELDARHIICQVMEGVSYLHSMDIIHRDLKPENILLRDKSDPRDIAISDFGLSRFIPDEGLLMTACGSPQYVSPEVLLGKGYGPAVDIWSVGVIAYALLAGYTPFYGDDQPTLFQQILKMKVEFEPQFWGEISDTAKDFILRCLCSADKRMTAKQALAHPWLANLPPVHEEAHRGCCLKSGVQANLTAMRRLRKAVTAVEAVNHLNRLHNLRLQHGESIPEKQRSLLSIVTNIRSHKRGNSLLPSPGGGGDMPMLNSDLVDTVKMTMKPEQQQLDEEKEAESQTKEKKLQDSAMSLDLVVMTVLMPENWGFSNVRQGGTERGERGPDQVATAGTQAVADAVNATMRGQGRVDNHDDGDAIRDGQASPSTSSTGQSEATARPALHRSSTSQRRSSRSVSRSNNPSDKTLNTLLDQYKTADVPRSARLDPAIKTRTPTKMTLANSWRYIPFLVNQGIAIGSAVASHAIYGPPKKSWGIEMSVFTRVLREVAQYSEFASIAGLQQAFDLGAFLPTPKDGLITPVTFRVKKRGLRGFLAEADAAEDGKREISGEWVVGKQTWRRLQSEWRNGKNKGKERVILYIHGGAYFVMSAATHRPLTISLSKYTECRVFGINYRLAPDTKFPGALHDCVASYFRLTEDLGIPPSNIVLGADSAGGGLALATLMYLRDNKYEMPSGAMLFSPWVDLTMSCDSWETNSEFDYLPMPQSGDHMNPVSAYLGENIDKYLTHPYASPLFGDMHGLPPLLVQCGDAEVLRDEVTLLAHKASLSGVAVRHELYEDCVHVFQVFLFLDASRKALQSARHFVRTALDKRGRSKLDVSDRTRDKVDKEMSQNMSTTKGEKVKTVTDESSKGKASSFEGGKVSPCGSADEGLGEIVVKPEDVEEDDEEPAGRPGNPTDEEDWELHGRTSSEFTSNIADAAGKAAAGSMETMQKVFGKDDHYATDMTNEGAKASKAKEEVGNLAEASGSTLSSFPAITVEEARLRGQAGMQQQFSTNAPALSRFHAPQKPLNPRMRRSQSGKELTGLIKSFEESGGKGLTTNVWTPGKDFDKN